jgi:preprotein translocase subunit SecA
MNAQHIHAGFYVQRHAAPESIGDRLWSSGVFRLNQLWKRRVSNADEFAEKVATYSDGRRFHALHQIVPELRYRLRRGPLSNDLIAECFGLYCSALHVTRAPLPTHAALSGARVLIEGGVLELAGAAERRAALALAASAMALKGVQVHLLTGNPSRAIAITDTMRAPLETLNIDAGVIVPGLSNSARREIYSKLIVCGASRDIGYDYLRDRIVLGARPRRVLGTLDRLSGESTANRSLFLAGMRCALVDDADYVMLDDTRAPVSVSTEADESEERLAYDQALELARALHERADFSLNESHAELTRRGSEQLARLTETLGGVWASRQSREHLIELALDAVHFRQVDRDYTLAHDGVTFPTRSPEDELTDSEQLLRKLIEVKEGCRLTGRRIVLAQMSMPRVLSRYMHLAGVCADARGLEHDFWRLYQLKTILAGNYDPPVNWRARLFATAAAKRNAVIECARAAVSRSVVIAVRTPSEAQSLLESCADAGIKSGLTRGIADAADLQAIADLAKPGAVTVSLYPAERTLTQPPVGAVSIQLVVAELHDAQRHITEIARAYAACSCEFLVSLEDDMLKAHLSASALRAAARAARGGEAPLALSEALVKRALRIVEWKANQVRRDAFSGERNVDDLLAFSGQRE